MPWRMYLIERTEHCRRSLRRYYKSDGRPFDPDHYHDETAVIDPEFYCPGNDNGRSSLIQGYENDPRWPKACGCGYVFLPEDHWQVNEGRLWRGSLDGRLYVLREHPPGATWAADWFPEEGPNGRYTGPDGKVWCVMLPAGMEWIIYGYASGPEPRQKWHVDGAVPKISVQPSISQVGKYHGHIHDGIITEDVDGRKFEGVPRTA